MGWPSYRDVWQSLLKHKLPYFIREKSGDGCNLLTLQCNQFVQEVNVVAVTFGYDTNRDVMRILLDGMVELLQYMTELVRTETEHFHWERSRARCNLLTMQCNKFAQEVNAVAVTLGYDTDEDFCEFYWMGCASCRDI